MDKHNLHQDEKFIRMTTAPVERLVCSLAVPSIATMMITAFYNMADTYFVGHLGTSEVAAVGVAFPLMAIVQAMGFFFGQGSANYMARALGARDTEQASRMAATGLVTGFLGMIIIAAACIIGLKPLVLGLGATATIAPYTQGYIFYILLGSPWLVAATVISLQLRFQGSATIAMVGMATGAVLNIFLDPLFIFVFGWGIEGAAIATMVSQIISFIVLFTYGCTRQGNIPVNFRHFSPSFSRYVEMSRGGIPPLLRQGTTSLLAIIINHFAGVYGDTAIAAISIINRLVFFANSMMLGLGQGFQPVCGFNYGAKLYGRVKKAFWFSVRIGAVVLFVIAIIAFIFAPQIIALFRKDDLEVIAIGARGLRLMCFSIPFGTWAIMCSMMTQTVGKTLYASLCAISRQGLFLLPSLLILTRVFNLGLLGIQLSLPIGEIMTFIMTIPIAIDVLWQMKESS
jgi:putative MATE family efflux protein